jgi:aminopeptidase N
MLQHVLGEENYRKSINLYLSRHGLQTVETWDLQKAIIDATGINMDWFFDQWIHRGGEPIYAVNWNVHANLGDNNSANVNDLFPQGQYDIEINVKQTQNQDIVVGLFRMPVDIEFLYFDGSSEKRTVWVDKSQHSFHFKTQKAPMTVVFDAGSRILKTLEMQKSPAEWLFQMEHGSSMLDRYDALVALRGIVAIHSGTAAHTGLGGSSDQTRTNGLIDFKTVLEQAWNREKFRELQVEIATQWLSLPGVFATTTAASTESADQQ